MDYNDLQINVINLSEKFIGEPFTNPKDFSKKSLAADFTISSHKSLESFIFNQVPKTISRMYVRDGVIFHTRRTVHEEYVKSYDSKGIHKYAVKIMKNIGRTSALLIKDVISEGGEDLNIRRKQLEEISLFPS